MAMPLIGITTSLSQGVQSLDCHYVEAVERAGGIPLLLPMVAKGESLAPLLEQLDGLVITGGPGIAEGLIGELPSDLPPVEARRWQTDLLIFDRTRQRGRPVLGICYGMQFINVRLGGRLYADVQRQLGVAAHSPDRNRGRKVEHEVFLEPGTLLAEVAGAAQARVNSFHLQAVERIGQGLRLSARSPDGLVEGIESEDGLLIGVQFHPERMPGTAWDRLFAHLVRRAQLD